MLNRRVSRRRALGAGVSTFAGGALIAAGCGDDDDNDGGGAPSGDASPGASPDAGQPVSGGTLRLGTSGFQFTNFDNATLFVTTPMLVASWVGESLLQFAPPDPDSGQYFQVEPALADGMPEETPDHLTITFKLVQTNWHNLPPVGGRPLTSEDVKLSIERAATDSPLFLRRTWYQPIDSIETPDPQTVVFHMKEPYAGFLHILANSFTSILPREYVENPDLLAAGVIGTGPFMFDEYRNGEFIRLVRNPDYRVAGRPRLDAIEYTWFGDPNSLQNAFTAGELDHVTISPSLIDEYREQNPDKVYIEMPFRGHYITVFNTRKPPFDDARVRRAIALLTDRDGMIQALSGGHGDWGAPIPLWNTPFAVDRSEIPSRNIEEARALLEEAGQSNLKMKATVAPFVLGPEQATLLQQTVKEAGVELEIENLELNAWVGRVKVQRDFEMYTFSNYVPEDPDQYLVANQGTGGSENDAGYSNPRVDELLADQRHAFDPEERKAIVVELQKILIEESPIIYNFDAREFWAFDPSVHDYYPSPSAGADARRSGPDVWKSA